MIGVAIPALVIVLFYAFFVLTPVYLLVCRYFKKRRSYFYLAIFLLWIVIVGLDANFSGVALPLSIGITLTTLFIAMISALVFSLAVGKE